MIKKNFNLPKTRTVLSLFLLVTFVALIFIHAFTMHVHVDEYGHIVVHSHVFPAGSTGKQNTEHTHSSAQMHAQAHFFEQIGGMLCSSSFSFLVFTALSIFTFFYFQISLTVYHRSFALRAPPSFSF